MHDLDVFADSDSISSRRTSVSGSKLSEVIYGNDIDSVDVAIRASLVKFFLSPNVIGDFSQHCRVLRLYSRPLVAFQKASFILSRQTPSDFARQLADTQVCFELFSTEIDQSHFNTLRRVSLQQKLIFKESSYKNIKQRVFWPFFS